MNRRTNLWIAVASFLLPNFIGFAIFTLAPVMLSLYMAFTNWSLKPAVEFEFLGFRNFADLLGVYPLAQGGSLLRLGYIVSAILAATGLLGSLWANLSGWAGVRIGNAILGGMGLLILVLAALQQAHQGVWVAGFVILAGGLAAMAVSEEEWKPGRGILFPAMLALGVLGLAGLNQAHWVAYESRDPRFWLYSYNTLFLMLGIPFGILGSLVLALLLSENIPLGSMRNRMAGAGLCLVSGAATLGILMALGFPNLGLLGGILWIVAALGLGLNVVAFRTIFYLPQFTSGVAIMILWKALYNPETGPINQILNMAFRAMGLEIEAPTWLSSVAWAKPALIFMGFWIGVGGTSMLLYLAALSNVPQELVDASHVDGASTWQRFRHVVWPQLAPTTFFILIMSIIGGLQGGFEQARVMTGGGPAGSTTTLSYYIYNKAFQDLDLGYAAAISWVLFLVIFVATAINWQFGKNLEVD